MCNHTPNPPPDPELPKWNDPKNKRRYNCYNYGTNRKTFRNRAQPGRGSGGQYTSLDCANVRTAAQNDGLTTVTDPNNCPAGTWPVALVVAPGLDYHWYRRNADGTWSHKPGRKCATNKDSSGNPITDPQTADRRIRLRGGGFHPGYTDFCGFMCTSGSVTAELEFPWESLPLEKAVVRGLPVTLSATSVIAVDVAFWAGGEDPVYDVTDHLDIQTIQSLLSLAVPTGSVSEVDGPGYGGYFLNATDVPGFPDEVVVYNGFITTLTGSTVEYFVDAGNLEGWLQTRQDQEGIVLP
jgi:hypothetical protein